MSHRPLRPPELSELAAFVAAVDEGSLAAAARRLHLTGPAVAKRIRNLETLSGQRLLDRSERGVRPTPEGRSLLVAASRILAEVRALVPEGGEESGLRIAGIQELIGSARALPASEVMLHETETLFSQVFHTSPDAIVVSNPADGTMIEVNDAFCRLSGYAREELRGHSSIELDLWGDPADRAQIAETLVREHVARGVAPFRRRDGAVIQVEYVAHVMRLRADEVLLIRVDDVTERRRLEQLAAVHQRRHVRLNEFAAALLGGAPAETVRAEALEILASELEAEAAFVTLAEPLELVGATGDSGPRLVRLVAELGLPDDGWPLVRGHDGRTVAIQRVDAPGRPQLALVVEAARPDLDPDALAMVAALASMSGVAVGWRRSSQMILRLIEYAPETILLVDDGGDILASNAAARSLLGLEPDARPALAEVLALEDGVADRWPAELLREGAFDASATVPCADGTRAELRLQVCGDLTPGRHLVVLTPPGGEAARPRPCEAG